MRSATWLIACAGSHALSLTCISWIFFVDMPVPTEHAYAAVSSAILIYLALHTLLGVIFALYGLYRGGAGYLSPARSLDLRIGVLWHDYTAAAGVLAIVLLFALPLVIGR